MSSLSSIFGGNRKQKEHQTPTVKEFYESRARRISVFRWICLLLTVLFVIYGFLVHGSELTEDNFRYMLKFLSFEEETEADPNSTVRFDFSDDNQGAIYKGDYVVLNENGISVYGKNSEKVFSFSFRMDNPRLAVSAENIFAYDLGGNEIRMFNSYSQIARLALNYPVYGFSACDAGQFAIITAEKNYRTAIYVYDQYARQTYKRLLSDSYADYVALAPDGSGFLTLGHYSEGGYLVSFLQSYSVKDTEPTLSLTFSGEMPLQVSWLSENEFSVLTNTTLRVYKVGTEEPSATLSLEDITLEGCSVSKGKILLTSAVSGLSGGTNLKVLDSNLQEVYASYYDGAVEQKTIIGDNIYILTISEITQISLTTKQAATYPVDHTVVGILEDSSGNPIIFEKGAAIPLSAYTAAVSSESE